MVLTGPHLATTVDVISNATAVQKMPSAGASNNGRIDGVSVFVRKGPILKVIT